MKRGFTVLRSVFGIVVVALGAVVSSRVLAAPAVVVTIKPVHGLVASVMEGVSEPHLLLQGGATPHSFSLKPSAARRLTKASVVFAVGAGLELGLDGVLASLAGQARVVYLASAKGVSHRAIADDPSHDHDHKESDGIDPHVWLNPNNARAMAEAVAAVLATVDPANAATYTANAQALSKRLGRLDRDLARMLAPVKDRPFVVFHDGYGYFTDHYGIAPLGSVAVAPGRHPGARHLSELRAKMKATGAVCVFTEPQFPPKQAQVLARDLGGRLGVLDPLGAEIGAGVGAYEKSLRAMAAALVDCLR